jgi:hypothetical protein
MEPQFHLRSLLPSQIRKRSHSTAMASHQSDATTILDPMERLAQLLRDACEVCPSATVNILVVTA